MTGKMPQGQSLPYVQAVPQQWDTGSELSDVPDDLSVCSEAERDARQGHGLQAAKEKTQFPGQQNAQVDHSASALDPVAQINLFQTDAAQAPTVPSTPPNKARDERDEVQPAQLPTPITPSPFKFSPPPDTQHESIVPNTQDERTVSNTQDEHTVRTRKRAKTSSSRAPTPPPNTLRRSKRTRKEPTRFAGIVQDYQAPEIGHTTEPDQPHKTEQLNSKVNSQFVRLSIPNTILGQLQAQPASPPSMETTPAKSTHPQSTPPQSTPPQSTPLDAEQGTERNGSAPQPDETEHQTAAMDQVVVFQHPGRFPRPGEKILSAIPKQGHYDSYLWKAMTELTAASPFGGEKPEPTGQPPIWAVRRADLCETLPYYRAFQSGEYSSQGLSRGFLFSNNAFERDYMDASVTISRAGGGMSEDEHGNMVQNADQEVTKVAKSLKNNMDKFFPVVHLTTKDNPLLPCQAPHEYCAMGHYKPTDIWVELHWVNSRKVKCVRYRFEKMPSGGEKIWWLPKGTEELTPRGSLPPPVSLTCKFCARTSVQVYLQGWMCLNDLCDAHWKLLTAGKGELRDPHEPDLVYDPRFLKQKSVSWPNEDHSFGLMPYDLAVSEDMPASALYCVHAWKGIVCPNCGCCTSRLAWKGWKCKTPGCGYERIPPRKAIPATALRDFYHSVRDTYPFSRDKIPEKMSENVIEEEPVWAYNYTIMTYRFPGTDAFIAHLIPNDTVLTHPGGPDDMFEELQLVEIGLERRTNGNREDKGARPIRHMNVNIGVPYNFVASKTDGDRNFDDTNTKCIPNARSLMKWATELVFALQQGKSIEEISKAWHSKQYNELLTLAYFEDQEIGWHDDGEHGLGPTIATLSLGCTGSMKVRMKALIHNGASATGIYDYKHRPIPGCSNYEERLAVHDTIVENAPAKYAKDYYKDCAKNLGLKGGHAPKHLLDMTLGHGDIVIMHGHILQQYFDHGVEHEGLLRAAMTCRYIDPESIPAGAMNYTVEPDKIGYDGTKLSIPRDNDGNPIGDTFGVWKKE